MALKAYTEVACTKAFLDTTIFILIGERLYRLKKKKGNKKKTQREKLFTVGFVNKHTNKSRNLELKKKILNHQQEKAW